MVQPRLVLALFAIFLLFHWLATILGSDRGQAGVIVGAVVVAATIAADRILFKQPLLIAARTLGLGRPRAMGLIAAAGISVLLLLVVPVFTRVTGASATFLPGWLAALFELGGATIWAPALVHFVIQGTVKLIVFSNDNGSTFPLVWMAASALIPFSIFFLPRVGQLQVTVL